MPDLDDIVTVAKEVGGVFKFGSGVLGRTSIAVGILLGAVLGAVFRLHSDGLIIGTLGVGALIFFIWFFYLLHFAAKHPDLALLEGAEWSGFQRFQAAAKGYLPSPEEKKPSSIPSDLVPDNKEASQ